MFVELEDFNTGWVGLKIALKKQDVDLLIENLMALKQDTTQHFHIQSDFNGDGGVGDIEIYVDEGSHENVQLTSLAIWPNR